MKIESSEVIEYPLEEVYRTFRDRLEEIAPLIPNVNRIEVLSRDQSNPKRIKLLNKWYAKGEIPALARTILKPEMLTWLDKAEWDDSKNCVNWQLETFFFKENIICGGVNSFRAIGPEKTEIVISGDLSIKLKDIPAVPRILQGKVAKEIEKFIVKLITPNLSNAIVGLKRFLDEKAKGKSSQAKKSKESKGTSKG